jgi:hypothetical protein
MRIGPALREGRHCAHASVSKSRGILTGVEGWGGRPKPGRPEVTGRLACYPRAHARKTPAGRGAPPEFALASGSSGWPPRPTSHPDRMGRGGPKHGRGGSARRRFSERFRAGCPSCQPERAQADPPLEDPGRRPRQRPTDYISLARRAQGSWTRRPRLLDPPRRLYASQVIAFYGPGAAALLRPVSGSGAPRTARDEGLAKKPPSSPTELMHALCRTSRLHLDAAGQGASRTTATKASALQCLLEGEATIVGWCASRSRACPARRRRSRTSSPRSWTARRASREVERAERLPFRSSSRPALLSLHGRHESSVARRAQEGRLGGGRPALAQSPAVDRRDPARVPPYPAPATGLLSSEEQTSGPGRRFLTYSVTLGEWTLRIPAPPACGA